MKPQVFLVGLLLSPIAAAAQQYLDCHFVPGWEQSGTARDYNAALTGMIPSRS